MAQPAPQRFAEYGGILSSAMRRHTKSAFQSALAALLVFANAAFADDAAGVMRVAVPSNATATVEMPFAPFGDATPGTFLSGVFLGDGGPYSDALYRLSALDGTYTNAVWSGAEWMDPASGEAASFTTTAGDMLVFSPGDDGGTEFFVHGRAPSVASATGHPRIGEEPSRWTRRTGRRT